VIPKGKGLPAYADDATLAEIRGKAMVGHQTLADVWTLLDHLLLLEHVLDEHVDLNDGLGPSGWRDFAQVESLQWRQEGRR